MKIDATNIHEANELTDADFERLAVGEVCCDDDCETLEQLLEDDSVTLFDPYEDNRSLAVDVAETLCNRFREVYEAGVRYGRTKMCATSGWALSPENAEGQDFTLHPNITVWIETGNTLVSLFFDEENHITSVQVFDNGAENEPTNRAFSYGTGRKPEN